MNILTTNRKGGPYETINHYMKAALTSSEYELEWIYGSHPRNTLKKIEFLNILRYLKQNYKFGGEKNDLDIKIQNIKLEKSGLSDIRCTISGVQNIKKYCKTNSIIDIPTVTFLKKLSNKDDKNPSLTFNQIKNTDYNFRINLKKEISLDDSDEDVIKFKDNLKDGLRAPLSGMSVAFSSSLLGLAGSLILGFVDLQLGQAQSKFSLFLEKILIENSSPDFISSNQNLDTVTLGSIQKIYDSLDSLVFTIKDTSRNQKEIYHFIQSLTEQIRELNTLNREQEKKLSNFLSTQLNTQATILELSSKLSKEGLMDKKTKLHLQNIDRGIKLLITKIKK